MACRVFALLFHSPAGRGGTGQCSGPRTPTRRPRTKVAAPPTPRSRGVCSLFCQSASSRVWAVWARGSRWLATPSSTFTRILASSRLHRLTLARRCPSEAASEAAERIATSPDSRGNFISCAAQAVQPTPRTKCTRACARIPASPSPQPERTVCHHLRGHGLPERRETDAPTTQSASRPLAAGTRYAPYRAYLSKGMR